MTVGEVIAHMIADESGKPFEEVMAILETHGKGELPEFFFQTLTFRQAQWAYHHLLKTPEHAQMIAAAAAILRTGQKKC